jgi:peptidoglycan-associated lipoprotein
MKRMLSIALLLAGTALLAGCPKKQNVNEPPAAGTQIDSSGKSAEGAATSSNPLGDDANGGSSRGLSPEVAAQNHKIIYFDFDKSEIRPEFADIVTTAAHLLTTNTSLKLKLEGNTDNRGTREYNIGLGERRAQAVRRALLLQGVAESQVATVSFGAERPAAEGDDESAWSRNRRVELVYQP